MPEKLQKQSQLKNTLVRPYKDPSNPANYRPISLLSGFKNSNSNSKSKIYEKRIGKRILTHVQNNNIIPPYQFGFQKGLSTTDQLNRLTKTVKVQRCLKKSTGLVLLDLEKAYDTVWHQGLIYKLIHLKFPPKDILLIESFLLNRKCIIQVSSTYSEPYTPPAGVPQGSVLSPRLFNIFISDIPSMKSAKRFAFADDFSVSSSARFPRTILQNLSHGIEKYVGYCTKWKLKLNENKTEAIYFTRFTSARKKT